MRANLSWEPQRRRVALLSLLPALLIMAWLSFAPSNASAAPAELWTECLPGSGAGQCSNPRGIAANPENGRLYVADQGNGRVLELDALGNFIKAWGWGVDTGAAALEVCTPGSGCQAAPFGSNTGQLSALPMGVAVDSAGNVYVEDRGLLGNPSVRVQKYGSDGSFILMFGGGVNKTKVQEGGKVDSEENLCPFDPGDECQAGTIGNGQGQFGSWEIGSHIAIDSKGTATDADDDVYVGDVGRIQRFDTDGNYQGEFSVSGNVQGLAIGPDGNLYAIIAGKVRKYSQSGILLPIAFEVSAATAVAVDSTGSVFVFKGGTKPICELAPGGGLVECFGEGFNASTGLAANLCPGSQAPGNLYAVNLSIPNAFVRAYGGKPVGCFRASTGEADPIGETTATLNGSVNPKGEAVSECFFEYGVSTAYGQSVSCDPSAGEIGTGTEPVPVQAEIGGLLKGTVHHFRLVARVGGELEKGVDATFKTLGPPVISEERATGATDTQATLKALVNPEGLLTSYRFEYGPTELYGQSTEEVPIGSERANKAAQTVLEGLDPGTTYHWRIVAINSSDESQGDDHLVRTYRPFARATDCLSRALRTGRSASLPDCRAYEMVSPVDKNGGNIVSGLVASDDPGGYMRAAPNGSKVTYTSTASFADQPNAFGVNQYLSTRGGDGWSTHGIHQPVKGDPGEAGLSREFMIFSEDLCSAWLIDHQTPPPSVQPAGQDGFPNLFRRDNCAPGAGLLEALVPEPPVLLAGTATTYVDQYSVQGISDDGRHALFVAKAKLPHVPKAATGSNGQIYDRFEGGLSLVSVLPSGAPNANHSVVGSGWDGNLEDAVSEDGTLAYWTSVTVGSTGTIFLREHPEQGTVPGECESGKACTRRVSGLQFPAFSFFWRGTPDGTKALFSEPPLDGGEEDELFEFSLARLKAGEPARRKLADEVVGVLGASDDLSRIYFISRQALPGTGGKAGEPNVYLREEDGAGEASFRLVATVSKGDAGAVEPGASFPAYDLAEERPYLRATRVSPDGAWLAFNSRAKLTNYDNTDTATGKPAVEVYAYDAEADELHCASCNPSGARPVGAEMGIPYNPRNLRTSVIAAAWIPTWEHPNYASNVLSGQGGRLFFNSSDQLVPRDANGAQDVYQWQVAGSGGCTASSPSYFPQNGGCVDLISSGESQHESEFWEASPDGEDVFFTTASSLVPPDPGLVDLYDARVGGGFPQLPEAGECEGEACQSPPAPPDFGAPASTTYSGPGNPPPRRCRRPARRSKAARRSTRRQGKAGRRCPPKGRAARRAGR